MMYGASLEMPGEAMWYVEDVACASLDSLEALHDVWRLARNARRGYVV